MLQVEAEAPAIPPLVQLPSLDSVLISSPAHAPVAAASPATGNDDDKEEVKKELLRREEQVTTTCCRMRIRLATEKQRLKSIRKELAAVFLFRAAPICPDSKFSSCWLTLLLIAVMYTMLYVPFSVAWPAAIPLLPWLVFDMIVDLIFLVDLFLNFVTSYVNEEDEWELDFRKCARHYLCGWFPLDLVASFPYDVVLLILEVIMREEGSYDQLQLNALQLLKLLRLLRVSKLIKFIASQSLSVASSLLVLVTTFVLLDHLFACLWWLVSVLENERENWVLLQYSIPDLANQPVSVQYSTCIYWSVVTTATLGYGDVTPKTYGEQIYAILVILTGAMFYTVVVGLVQQLVAWKFSTGAEYNQWMDRVIAFCNRNKLDREMKRKLTGYYQYVWKRRRTFDRGETSASSFMNDLPFELKIDVADNIHAKLFRTNAVFQSSRSSFKHYLATKLGPGQVKLPDEVLFFEGEPADSIILVRDGLLELVLSMDRANKLTKNIMTVEHDELVVSSRTDGQYCGDQGLFTPERVHFVSCVVAQFSDIHVIAAEDFLSVLDGFPEERALFERVALQRTERISKLVALFRRYTAAYRNPNAEESRKLIGAVLHLSAAQVRVTPNALLQSKLDGALWQLWEKEVKPEQDNRLCEMEVAALGRQQQRRESSTEDSANDNHLDMLRFFPPVPPPAAAEPASPDVVAAAKAVDAERDNTMDALLDSLAKQVADLEARLHVSSGKEEEDALPQISANTSSRPRRRRAHSADDTTQPTL